MSSTVATDLWMAAHDKLKGNSALSGRPLGIGLGAALICELLMYTWLTDVVDGQLILNPEALTDPPPETSPWAAALAHMVKASKRDGRHSRELAELDLATWIELFSTGLASELVEGHLAHSGLIEQRKRRLRGTTFWVPKSGNHSGWPATRLKHALRRGEELDQEDLVLAGLIIAIGMDGPVLTDVDGRQRRFLANQMRQSLRPQLTEVIRAAEYATGLLALHR